MIDKPVFVSMAVDVVRYINMGKYNDMENLLEGAQEIYHDDDDHEMSTAMEFLLHYLRTARDANDPTIGVAWVDMLITVMELRDEYRKMESIRTMHETIQDTKEDIGQE